MSPPPASTEPAANAASAGPATHAATGPAPAPAAATNTPTKEPMKIEAKLGWNVFKLDSEPHILIDHALCREHCSLRPCLHICPANLYSLETEPVPSSSATDAAAAPTAAQAGDIKVDFEGCLECGSCLIVCPEGALTWHYPRAGLGVMYKFS